MFLLTIMVVMLLSRCAGAQEELLVNGGFEEGPAGWQDFWSRDGQGEALVVKDVVHGGGRAAHVQYRGRADWSLGSGNPLPVRPGDIFQLRGWVRTQGEGDATLGVILYDESGNALSWVFGGKSVRGTHAWKALRSRFVIPPGGAAILPRLTGHGPSETWLDDVSLIRTGRLDALRSPDLPPRLTIASDVVEVTFTPADGSLTITNRKTGRVYRPQSGVAPLVLKAGIQDGQIRLQLLKPEEMLTVDATIELERDAPELLVRLRATGPMDGPLAFPKPFRTRPDEFLILPVNEGISYPVADSSLKPMQYHLYGGHGLCMAFWGVTDLNQGLLAIVETPDDALVRVPRVGGRLCLAPVWLPQKTVFGPERRIRYVLIDQGGYVAMCKRYRQYAKQMGRLRTLAEKRRENPNVDRLIGAVNVWNWDMAPVAICREMKELGIERVLWSHRCQPEQIRRLNKMGVLTSRYDIYQDVMNPANFPKLRGVHPDWPTAAWPDGVIIGKDGQITSGWRVKGRDGKWYACGVLCDRLAVDYARRRIPLELQSHAYQCRFIDTTTAAAWRECYSPKHPMTRTDSRRFRMQLLEYVSKTCGLVTGSETGHDAAVPFVHYFEGMLSLGPYRVRDAGRNMLQVVNEVPEAIARFQTGHYYRLPLWELVYHDCVVAQWYWGDYNNKLPAVWDRRDLLNALYGTPPMFMLNRKIWEANRARFARSYQTATPVARATGYHEMLCHQWLTADHAVQQSRFANGVVVTVNFGPRPFPMADGSVLKPLEHRVEAASGP